MLGTIRRIYFYLYKLYFFKKLKINSYPMEFSEPFILYRELLKKYIFSIDLITFSQILNSLPLDFKHISVELKQYQSASPAVFSQELNAIDAMLRDAKNLNAPPQTFLLLCCSYPYILHEKISAKIHPTKEEAFSPFIYAMQ